MKLLTTTENQSNNADLISEKAMQKNELELKHESTRMWLISEFLSSKHNDGSVDPQSHQKGKLTANLMLFVICFTSAPLVGQTSCHSKLSPATKNKGLPLGCNEKKYFENLMSSDLLDLMNFILGNKRNRHNLRSQRIWRNFWRRVKYQNSGVSVSEKGENRKHEFSVLLIG